MTEGAQLNILRSIYQHSVQAKSLCQQYCVELDLKTICDLDVHK